MTSTADALSGPWAANVSGWAVTTALASTVVVVQELVTEFPHPGWIALTLLLQTAGATFWAVAVATLSRRRYGRVVRTAQVLLWAGIGVVRGLIGGSVAAAAGLDPEWIYRVAFWTLASLSWMPLLTYALARWDEHRRLLAGRAALGLAVDDATARAAESTGARAERMSRAADDALRPAIDEIRAGLRENAALEPAEARAIAARLDELASRTATFTAPSAITVPRVTGRVSVQSASREFELGRPVFAALLAAAETAPLMIPEAYRDDGWTSVAEVVVAIVVSTLVLTGVYALVRPARFTGAQRSVLSRIGVAAAGLAGAGVLTLLPWDPFQYSDLALLLVFPLVFATAASATATAVALDATNVQLQAQVAGERAALDELATRVRLADEEAAARLELLVRGEVNGRVASCVLALGMLADGALPAESRERVITGVLAQLDAAAEELRP